jgi:hypothetical protein
MLPAAATASCDILTLTLGPLDLNLQGLVIHLNQVVLTINAVPGPATSSETFSAQQRTF